MIAPSVVFSRLSDVDFKELDYTWSEEKKKKYCNECKAYFIPTHMTVLALRLGYHLMLKTKDVIWRSLIHTTKVMVMMFIFTEEQQYIAYTYAL